ncbi:MAG TPA: hypothetical protein VNW92_30560 [Polyangiaceae bacterium]|nr:hypothetical protein [Polyangiaceae bacterium]
MGVGFLLNLGLWSTASCTLPALGDPAPDPNPPPSGFAVGGAPSVGSGPGFGGVGNGELSCQPPITNAPIFGGQAVDSQTPFARELYAWTTDDDARALRQDQQLFAQPAGSGAPFTFLSRLTSSDVGPLAQALASTFNKGRYAWPEPWATRMGWPGQDPGGQLVRIVLKPEAWLAFSADGVLSVFDAQQQPVSPETALANQALIGAIYFDSSPSNLGDCASETSGYRGFLLGNLAMVKEWSVGTQLIHDRLLANIGQLTQFLNSTRSCPVANDSNTWAQVMLCLWQNERGSLGATDTGAGGFGNAGAGGFGDAGVGGAGFGGASASAPIAGGTEEAAYDQALAFATPNYLPAPMQIATIIETLQGDLFEPDPLVVTPGNP